MRVRYLKGSAPECEMKDKVAKKMIAKGKVEAVKPARSSKKESTNAEVSSTKTGQHQ